MSVPEPGRQLLDFASENRINGPDVVPYHADPSSYSTAIISGSGKRYDNRTSEQRPLLGRSRSRNMESFSDSEYGSNIIDDPEFAAIIRSVEQVGLRFTDILCSTACATILVDDICVAEVGDLVFI